MKFGNNSVDIVSDGSFLLDGGVVFGQVPKAHWELQMKPDRKNRVRMGLNCLLVQTQNMNILVDTGAGSKRPDKYRDLYGLNGNKLNKGLKAVGLTPRDIDVVILTHLHFDHVGGCTKLDRSGAAVPTFPKATYIVQASAWEEARGPNERGKYAYNDDDFLPLEEKEVLKLVDGDYEVAPGVTAKLTNGHAGGHQIVLIEAGAEKIAYVGDLIPTPFHIPLPNISASDQSPNGTLAQKRGLLEMAVDGGWLLIFGHAFAQRAGYVEQRNGKRQLLPVDI